MIWYFIAGCWSSLFLAHVWRMRWLKRKHDA